MFSFFFSASLSPPAPLELIKGRKRVFIPPGQRDAALRGREGASRPLAPASQSVPAGILRLHPPASRGLPRSVRIAEPPGVWVCVLHMPPSPPTACQGLEATGFGMGISSTFMPWHFLVSVGCRGFLGYTVAVLWWFVVAQCPVLMGLDTHCSALTPGDKNALGTPR